MWARLKWFFFLTKKYIFFWFCQKICRRFRKNKKLGNERLLASLVSASLASLVSASLASLVSASLASLVGASLASLVNASLASLVSASLASLVIKNIWEENLERWVKYWLLLYKENIIFFMKWYYNCSFDVWEIRVSRNK